MFFSHAKAAIEALLFTAGEPVPLKKLAEALQIDNNNVEMLVEQMKFAYNASERGLQIVEIAGGYQLCTKPDMAQYLENYFKPHQVSLSQAALETLSIIAFKQPVTKAEIEAIRGVKIDSALKTLLERKLVKEVGRKEGLGRPILYGTSEEFLKCFGLKDLSELPVIVESVEQGLQTEDTKDQGGG